MTVFCKFVCRTFRYSPKGNISFLGVGNTLLPFKGNHHHIRPHTLKCDLILQNTCEKVGTAKKKETKSASSGLRGVMSSQD